MMVKVVNRQSSQSGENISPDWQWRQCHQIGDARRMANRIKELRLERGLTLEELAEMVGTSLQQISRLELGDRRLSEKWMRPIARALGVSPGDLLSDATPDPVSSAQQAEQFLVWQLWSRMTLDERKFWASWGKQKGIDLLSVIDRGGKPPSNKAKRAPSAA